jgi:hypothetical protein
MCYIVENSLGRSYISGFGKEILNSVVMDFEDADVILYHDVVVMHAIHYLIFHRLLHPVQFLEFIYFGSSFHVASFQFEGETA